MSSSRIKRFMWTFVTLFASAGAVTSSYADEVISGPYVSKLMDQRLVTMSGQCLVSVKPDHASITIVLDGEGSTPDEAHQMLAGLRDKTQALIARHHGKYKQQEIQRMMRSSDPAPSQAAMSLSSPGSGQPSSVNTFVYSQRVDLELPMTVDVDAVLLALHKSGIRRIGRIAAVSSAYVRSTQPQPVVFYGFSDPEKVAETAHQQCRVQAVEYWCKTKATAEHQEKCVAEIKMSLSRFMTQSMSLQPVSRNPGYPGIGNISLSYPFKPAVLSQMVVSGREPVELSGNITLRQSGMPGW